MGVPVPKLTPKQSRFVDEYLVDLCATKAAIRAGYSRHTAGQIGEENLKKPGIAAAVQERMRSRANRTAITQDMVVAELARIAFANIGDVLDKDGAVKSFGEVPSAILSAIAAYDETRIMADGRKIGVQRRVRMHDKLAALNMLAGHLGMGNSPVGQDDRDDPIKRLVMQAQGTTLKPVPRSAIR